MRSELDTIGNLDDLRGFVHQTLCERENILQDQFSLTEALLSRQGRACGIKFSLNGPRNVRLEAIWAAERNVLYFYDARGIRFLKLQVPRHLEIRAA
jgi:hypothetical protein